MVEEKGNSESVNIFLLDGTAQGRIKCTLANWNGIAYKIPREYMEACKSSKYQIKDHIAYSGVYFLFGEKDTPKPIVYIGQSSVRQNESSFLTRWQEHTEEYWTEAIAITTTDNSFGPTELCYLEHNFYKLVKQADRYNLKNQSTPPKGNATEEKTCELNKFIESAKIVIGVLGHNLFDKKDNKKNKNVNLPRFYIYDNDKRLAQAEIKDNKFYVLKDGCILRRLDKLSERGILSREKYKSFINKDENGIIEDIPFSSPTAASDFILGTHQSGPTVWKTADGKTLKDLGENRNK